MLNVYYSENAESVTISFDQEGRDRLIKLLQSITEPGEHVHLLAEFGYPYNLDLGSEDPFHGKPAIGLDIGWTRQSQA